MRCALLLLAFGLFAWEANAVSPAFTIGREYHYDISQRVVSGVPHVMQFAISGLKAKAIIQNQGRDITTGKENELYLKLTDFKIGRYNGEVHEDIEDEFHVEYTDTVTDNYKKIFTILSKPIRFVMDKGLITELDVHPGDETWSVNMKKAMLSSLQLNFERKNQVRFSQSNYLKPEESTDFFRVMEDGIGGLCETVYELHEYPYYENPYEPVLNVTKNRMYDKCTKRPFYSHTTHTGPRCEGCQMVEPLQTVSRSEYHIRGDRRFYTIEKIFTTGKYLFTPFTTEGEEYLVGVNQTWFLDEIVPITKPLTLPEGYTEIHNLEYDFETLLEIDSEDDLSKPNYFPTSIHYEKDLPTKEKLYTLLEKMGHDHDLTLDIAHENLAEYTISTLEVISMMDYNTLKEVYTELDDHAKESKEKEIMRTLFLEALPLVGTNPTVKGILSLVDKKLLNLRESVAAFTELPIYVKDVTPVLLDYYYKIMENVGKTTMKPLYSSMWLAFGTLLHRGCEEGSGVHHTTTFHNYEYKHTVPSTVCKRYNTLVYNKFMEATTTWEKLLYIKVLGNIAMDDSYEYLKPIVDGHKPYKTYIRKVAAEALMNMAHDMHEEVLTIAIPLFYNYTEEPIMRIMGFEMIMATEPDFEEIYNIGMELGHDPSNQVASYVISTFNTLVNCTDPCHEKISKKIKQVLDIIPDLDFGHGYAHKEMLTYFNDKYNFGSEAVVAYVGDNDSFIPEHLYIRKSFNVYGHRFDALELTMYMDGFHQIWEEIFGPGGLFSPVDETKSTFDIFRRHPRSVNTVEKELNEIDRALKMTPREYEPIRAGFSFKMFNQEVLFTYLDSALFENFKKEKHFFLPKEIPEMLRTKGLTFNYHKIGLLADIRFEIPTVVGLPMVIAIKVPSYTELTGTVKIDVVPGFFPDERDNKKPKDIKIETDLHPLFTMRSIVRFGVNTPSLSSYLTVKHSELDLQYALKTKLDYDLTEKKLKINYWPTQKPYEIFHYETSTETSSSPTFWGPIKFTDTPTNIKNISYFPNNLIKEKDFEIGKKYLGVGLHVNIKHQYPWYNFGSFWQTLTDFAARKSRSFDPVDYYYYWVERIRNGLQHMTDYFWLNPTDRPFNFRVMYEPNKETPTTEFEYTMDFDMYKFGKALFTEETLPIPTESKDKTTYNLHLELTGKGKVERKFTTEINVIAAKPGDNSRKVTIDFERTPIPEYDPNPLKVCYRSTTKYPTYTNWYSIDKDEIKVESHYELSVGKECNKKILDIEMLAERTDKQKYLLEHPTEYEPYVQCQEEIKKGYNFSDSCWEVFKSAYNLKKYTIDVEYENLPDFLANKTIKLGKWLRHIFYDNLEINTLDINNPENKLKIVANFSTTKPVVDVKVYKPHQNMFFKKIYYPRVFPTFKPVNARVNYLKQYVDEFFDHAQEPFCIIQNDHFLTFDYVHYKFPLSNCYHVIFRDCSPDERFTVLAKKIDHEMYKKSLKIFLGSHKVEVIPLGENPKTAPLVLRIDGSKKVLTENFLKFTDPENEKTVIFTIRKTNNWYVLTSRLYGITIYYDGVMLKSMISTFHRGHVCGLCGEYNGEEYNEFVGPDGCIYHNETQFGYSYAIKEDTCTLPELKTVECHKPIPKYVQAPQKCIQYRNKVTYTDVVDGQKKRSSNVCFSRLPVPECAPGCEPTFKVKNRVGFHCLNARDGTTERLIAQSKTTELTQLQNKSEDYHEDVEYPESCVRSH